MIYKILYFSSLMNQLNRKLNYYIFIALRKIARIGRQFKLSKKKLTIAYASALPRADIQRLLDWYLPIDHNFIQIDLEDKTVFSSFDLVLYDYPSIKFNFNLLKNIAKIAPINPCYYSIAEVSNWSSLFPLTLSDSDKQEYNNKFRDNFAKLKTDYKVDQSWIFGTGPSIEMYPHLPVDDASFKIICNSIIKNKEFCEAIRPTVIAFADPVFHFGHSMYALQFRKDLVEGINRFNLTAIMPLHHAYLFVNQYPKLIDKVVGIEFTNKWNFDLSLDLSVKRTENILSLLLLPLASTFSKEINLIGFDGKPPYQTDYFWKHHSMFQYTEYMNEVIMEHRSFFDDRDFSCYSDKHSKVVESAFTKLELLNIKIKSHSKSFIPSINERH